MNDEKKRTIRSVAGLIVLLLLCVAGVQAVFAGLGMAIPKEEGQQVVRYTLLTAEGSGSRYVLSFPEQDGEDVAQWLEAAQAWDENTAYLLWLKDADQYLLYLPMQDRTVDADDMTATEELDEDGEIALVLRIRTAEDSEEIDPAEQLFTVQTTSERWNGIRIRLILDGREVPVYKCVSDQGTVYSSEEVYMGRK